MYAGLQVVSLRSRTPDARDLFAMRAGHFPAYRRGPFVMHTGRR